jgi:hypothetical protein
VDTIQARGRVRTCPAALTLDAKMQHPLAALYIADVRPAELLAAHAVTRGGSPISPERGCP